MGLAFALMIDTKLGSESFTLIFHTEGCQRGSHLDQAFPEKAADWNEARTQHGSCQGLNAEMILKIKIITVVYVLCYLRCVISAFPSRGDRRVRSGPSGAVQ